MEDKNEERFNQFWKAYPRDPRNKEQSKRVFDKLKVDDDTLQKMLQALELHKNTGTLYMYNDTCMLRPEIWLKEKAWLVTNPMEASLKNETERKNV